MSTTNDEMKHLIESEVKYQPAVNFMDHQKEVTSAMRLATVDWLITVFDKEEMSDEAFFLAVNIMDRFLAAQQVATAELKLLGLTAAFMAGKYEEVEIPDAARLLKYVKNQWEIDELLQTELVVFSGLEYQLTRTTPYTILSWYLHKMANTSSKLHKVATYLTKAALLKPHVMTQFRPTHVAAAAIYLAHRVLKIEDTWPAVLQECSGLQVSAFIEGAHSIWEIVQRLKGSRYNRLSQVYSGLPMERVTRLIEAADLSFE